MSERREHERHLIRMLAILKFANGVIIEGKTREMSMGGAFIECDTDVELHEGDTCTVSLTLEETGETIDTEIYSTITHRGGQGIGCKFLKINSTYYQFMGNLIDD
jgi:hypothetical protein